GRHRGGIVEDNGGGTQLLEGGERVLPSVGGEPVGTEGLDGHQQHAARSFRRRPPLPDGGRGTTLRGQDEERHSGEHAHSHHGRSSKAAKNTGRRDLPPRAGASAEKRKGRGVAPAA